nr:MAG TPA: hypothetical protein [Caudoviricetes sp.]
MISIHKRKFCICRHCLSSFLPILRIYYDVQLGKVIHIYILL